MNAHTMTEDLELDCVVKTINRTMHLMDSARLIAGMRDGDAEIASIAAIIDTVSEQLDDVLKILGARSAVCAKAATSSVGQTELADLIEARKPIAAAYIEASERFQELKSDRSGSAVARRQASADHETLHQQLVQAEQAIYDYRPTNMAEVAMKAQFAIAEGVEGDLIDRFLRSLL